MLYGLSGIFSFAFVCFSFCEIDLEPKGRSRHHEVFCRKRILKNFAKFTAKHLCQSIFFKKRDSDAGVFPVYFAKIQITLFTEHLQCCFSKGYDQRFKYLFFLQEKVWSL